MHKRFIQGILPAASLLFVLAIPTPVLASQSFYTTSGNLRTGMLASLTRNPTVVEPSTNKMDTSLVGVVVDPQDDISVEPGQVLVQTDGVANVLVSTLDGDIRVGDRIGPSSVVGLGSKLAKNGWVVGSAQQDFSASSPGAVKTTVVDSTGAKHEVHVASIPLQIKVSYYTETTAANAKKDSPVPDTVQELADGVAGKRASVIAVILSFMLLLSGLAIAGLIVVTTVRNGIQAISRQPLVRQTVVWRMVQAFGLAIAIIVSVNVGALVILRIL